MTYFFLALLSHVSVYTSTPEYKIEQVSFDAETQEIFSLSRKPTFNGTWNQVPTVFVCEHTPITESRVRKAMNTWQRLGYDTTGPVMNSTIPACIGNSYSYGNIVIELRGQSFEEDKLAMARTYRRTDTGEIVGAKIFIQSFAAEKERTLEHEFGHVFGWNHFNRQYHLMHEMHYLGGWDTYGLRNPNR